MRSFTARLKTCRLCGRCSSDRGHRNDQSHWIKYGPRHSAHLCCLIRTRDAALIFRDLPTWKLEEMPFLEIVDLGLEQILREELSKRTDRKPLELIRTKHEEGKEKKFLEQLRQEIKSKTEATDVRLQ